MKALRNTKPGVIGHIAASDPALAAIRLRERIRKDGAQTLWIGDDGCLLAQDATRKISADANALIGTYTIATKASGIADDIAASRDEYAAAAIKARA